MKILIELDDNAAVYTSKALMDICYRDVMYSVPQSEVRKIVELINKIGAEINDQISKP